MLLAVLGSLVFNLKTIAMESNNQSANFKDHRDLGREMELFMSVDVAPGAPILLENGLVMYRELTNLMGQYLREVGGVQEVRVPALSKSDIWDQSGHLAKFEENMYLMGEGADRVGLKPMNCPLHMLIFDSRNRSYRELPYRIHDEGILHRKENSGSLHGLARLIQFHQDDTHIFLAPDQIEAEFHRCLQMVKDVYRAFGFSYRACLSTKPEKFLGDEEVWARSEAILEAALKAKGFDFSIDVGGGAFYGPKIGIEVQGSKEKWWQVATVQIDYNLPERFNLKFIDAHGQQKRPVVLHMALYGAIERFMGIYLEHVQGNLPLKLAPQQFRIYPVSDRHQRYAYHVTRQLVGAGFRAVLDDGNETLGARLRGARRFRAPYSIVVGDSELSSQSVSVRKRASEAAQGMQIADLISAASAEAVWSIEPSESLNELLGNDTYRGNLTS